MILKSRFRVDRGYSKSEDSNRVLREKSRFTKSGFFQWSTYFIKEQSTDKRQGKGLYYSPASVTTPQKSLRVGDNVSQGQRKHWPQRTTSDLKKRRTTFVSILSRKLIFLSLFNAYNFILAINSCHSIRRFLWLKNMAGCQRPQVTGEVAADTLLLYCVLTSQKTWRLPGTKPVQNLLSLQS